MTNIIEDFPFTLVLALIGLIIGLLVPSPFQDFIMNLNFENVTNDPAGTITTYAIGMPIAIIGEISIKVITSLILGIIGGIIGLFIDIIKNNGGPPSL